MNTRNVLDWLEASAQRRPEALAFASQDSVITYEKLNIRSKEIGSYLLKHVERQQGVLVFMEKGPACLSAMMGIVRAGCFYTPIDPVMPRERMQLIVSVLKPACILCNSKYLEKAKELADVPVFAEEEIPGTARAVCLADSAAETAGGEAGESASDAAGADAAAEEPGYIDEEALAAVRRQHLDNDLLYVLFTSGSTGLPKGVAITHRSVIDFIDWTSSTLPVDENCVFGNQAPLYFDNSVLDIYTSLRIGACVHFIPASLFSFTGKLLKYMTEHAVNTVFWVPSALANLAGSGALENAGGELPALRNIFFCGEVMHCSTLNILKKYFPDAVYINMYGPTEITDVCAWYRIDREFADTDKLPIGYPCSNSWVGLIDGEICVGGTCLSPGYYNAPEKTAEVFVQNPLRPQIREIIYKTGDLGEYNDRGELMFLGRKDSQIKKHGYRIELGEIETAMSSVPGILKCCCLFDSNTENIISIYTGDVPEKEIQRSLKKKLPKYMLPDIYAQKESLPETGNGKMDRVRIRKEWESGQK